MAFLGKKYTLHFLKFYLWLQNVVKHRHISTGVFPSLSYRDPATSISGTKEAFSIISQACYSRVVGHQMGSDLDPRSSIMKVTHPCLCRCQSVESLVSGHCSDPHKTKPPRHCLHSMNRITCLIKPAQCQSGRGEHEQRPVKQKLNPWFGKLSLCFMWHIWCATWSAENTTKHTSGDCYLGWKE